MKTITQLVILVKNNLCTELPRWASLSSSLTVYKKGSHCVVKPLANNVIVFHTHMRFLFKLFNFFK